MQTMRAPLLGLLLGMAIAGCDESHWDMPRDGGGGRDDAADDARADVAADITRDAALDAPGSELDAALSPLDGEPVVLDSGSVTEDSGGPELDGGTSGDASAVDAHVDAGALHQNAFGEPCGGDAAIGRSERFTVPPDGGVFAFCTASGGVLALDFPASSAGLDVTASDIDPQTFPWANGGFASAVRELVALEPAGARFVEPVKVRLPFGALLGFTFDAITGMPNPLTRTSDHTSQLLHSLAPIGLLGTDSSCEVEAGSYASGWHDEEDSGYCSAAGSGWTFRSFACARTPFCYTMQIGCCVAANDPGVACTLTDRSFGFETFYDFRRITADEKHGYCAQEGITPYVQAVDPPRLVANGIDQTVRIRGSHLSPSGFATASVGSGTKQTRWISSNEVEVVVAGNAVKPGRTELALSYVNYEGAYPPHGYRWDQLSNELTVPVDVAAVVCPVPTRGPSPIGQCTVTTGGCGCSMTFDPGAGEHTYEMVCNRSACSCMRDGEVINVDATTAIYACNFDNVTRAWDDLCHPTPGFCP